MAEIDEKNASALDATIKAQDKVLREQQQRIDGLNNTMASLFQRIELMENSISQMRVQLYAHKATA